MIKTTYLCNFCENDLEENPSDDHIIHFGMEDYRIDFCNDVCETQFQNECEHHTAETEGMENICYDCGRIVAHPDL
ncbi:hypothetical protein LCGC14_0364660 [marine sediment metagenome]|uniref:Uncharacterized protein n=1 Tax=marine sediment metagenome TaxID=412755 RepID=A0A0F9TCQ9_9ZZZZ